MIYKFGTGESGTIMGKLYKEKSLNFSSKSIVHSNDKLYLLKYLKNEVRAL